MMNTFKIKLKICKACKAEFVPYRTTQKACSPECAYKLVQIEAVRKQEREERKELKRRKEALKTKSQKLNEVQELCNKLIRLQNQGALCISCQKPPKKINCGHYLSRGAHPEIRFHPFNLAIQCEYCNTYKSGNQVNYRINLVEKIGIENVEWLEGPHQAQNWTDEDIEMAKQYYRDQIKQLKA